MKGFLRILSALLLSIVSAQFASAQIKDGEATVIQGSTITVSIGAAYQSTLNRATGINYTWTAGSSAISIQSKTNKTCTIKGNTPGTAKLNYHCSYYIDGYYRTMDFYYDITIKSNSISVTRIEMTPSSATLEVGETLQLNATAYPTNATNRNLIWSTENYSVASVSSNGLVTARGAGRVWIWARATDGSGAGNYCVIDVSEPTKVSSITLSETEKSMVIGEVFNLTATVNPENAYNKNLIWSSDNEDVATVTDGEVTAVKQGVCNIICEATDGSDVSAICHIVVQKAEQYWLTVIVPNGNFAVNVTDLENVSLKITPDNGYSIHSISLDEKEIVHENGEIILPGFTHDSCLNIVFEDNQSSNTETIDATSSSVKVCVSGHTVFIDGVAPNDAVHIYDLSGSLICVTRNNTIDLPISGIYILKIGNKSFKLAIQ